MTTLVAPHGDKLLNLYAQPDALKDEKEKAANGLSWDLTPRQLCDVELLLCGGFSPLEGFLTEADYNSVVGGMRLQSGLLWPMPVTLDVDESFASQLLGGQTIALRDQEGVVIANMCVTSIWKPDKEREAEQVFSTQDESHPGVYYLKKQAGDYYIGGRLIGVTPPLHYDFKQFRYTPQALRSHFQNKGWGRVIAFQSRNPIHRAHVILSKRLMAEHQARFMIHAAVGITKPGDIDPYCRVRCYQRILTKYPGQSAGLSLVPIAMRMAGPREALWQAIIRQNYGFSHFLVGRDHAGPGRDNRGGTFYAVDASIEMVLKYQHELAITPIPLPFLLYSPSRGEFCESEKLLDGEKGHYLSGADLRQLLHDGQAIPEWFTYPEVIEELHRELPPKNKLGFTLFFTGFSGSGKSTLANGLVVKIREIGGRKVTLLDGDVVRKNLSSELNFSKAHRDINILRIGYVASEITKNGGVAVCAPIAPYGATRAEVRRAVAEVGVFIEIHVSTPIEVCEARDRKGLYALARAGKIKEFTGISDPYEVPENPDLRIDTTELDMEEGVDKVFQHIVKMGLIEVDAIDQSIQLN